MGLEGKSGEMELAFFIGYWYWMSIILSRIVLKYF